MLKKSRLLGKTSSLLSEIHKVKFLNKRFKKVQRYLISGLYKFNYDEYIIFINNIEVAEFITSSLNISLSKSQRKGIKQALVSFLFKNKKIIPNIVNKTSFEGSIILFSNKSKNEIQYGDLKIFDFKNKKILTDYYTRASFEKKLNDTRYFKHFFNIPLIESFIDDERITIEEFINYIPVEKLLATDFLNITQYIYDTYTEYFRYCMKSGLVTYFNPYCFFDYSNLDKKNKANIDIIKSYLGDNILKMVFPVVYQHGDLSYSNILLTKEKKCFLIDWEHSSDFNFLYDIMWPWLNAALHSQNYFMIERYLKGLFDGQMEHVFSVFNLKYNSKYRMQYFLIMISEFICKRVLMKEPHKYNSFLNNRVMPMIEKMVFFNKNQI